MRQAAVLNYELYGLYGISVWLAGAGRPRGLLETTKLIKFERYAGFTVADLTARQLRLEPTGQRPHYDVVYGDDVDTLADLLARTPHRIRVNPHVDREEH